MTDAASFDPSVQRRDVVHVEGADARRYLHSQLSQHIERLAVGESAWSFLLQPNGKIDVLARVRRTGDESFDLDVDAGYGEVLLARLNRFKIRVDATTRLEDAVDGSPETSVERDARIAARWPAMGAEIVPGETLPASTGVTGDAVGFGKGCYPGQELVERMDSRGAEAPMHLGVLAIGEHVPPAVIAGDDVVDATGGVVGRVTSVGSTHVLAYLKRGAACC